jgi:hypothetical protein
MSGGATGTEPLTGRGHSIGGTGRWFPPSSNII